MKQFLLQLALIFSLILQFQRVYADVNTQYNIRSCLLLPIIGQGKEVDIFKIYERIESYLRKSKWCYYKSNTSVLSILQEKQPNLDLYLENTNFLREISSRTRVGSMIRTKVLDTKKGMKISVEILGDNGRDIFFVEVKMIDERDTDFISQIIIDWLDDYKEKIPYDGRVVGAKGKEFLVDIGRSDNISPGDVVVVERAVRKKNHPLIEEIVDWETNIIGEGKVNNVSNNRSLVEITSVPSSFRGNLKQGDWIIMQKRNDKRSMNFSHDPRGSSVMERLKSDSKDHGASLGLLSLGLKGAIGNDTTSINVNQRIVGLLLGPHITGELWLTKNFLSVIHLEKNIGVYRRSTKNGGRSSLNVVQDIYKIKFGYRFFLGDSSSSSKIDTFLGYGGYEYDLSVIPFEGFGNHQLYGWLFGFKGTVPFTEKWTGFLRLDFLVADYGEDTRIFREKTNSTGSYQVDFGASYYYWPRLTLDFSFELTSNEASFQKNQSFKFIENSIKTGVTFLY